MECLQQTSFHTAFKHTNLLVVEYESSLFIRPALSNPTKLGFGDLHQHGQIVVHPTQARKKNVNALRASTQSTTTRFFVDGAIPSESSLQSNQANDYLTQSKGGG